MTRDDWLEVVSLIADLWPHSVVPPDTAAAWFPLVADLDARQAARAVYALRADPEQRYAPGPGKIRQATEDGSDWTSAGWMDAWMEVADAVAGGKGRVTHKGDDPVAAEFVSQLPEWCEDVQVSDTMRAQFRDWWKTRRRQTLDSRRTDLASHALDQRSVPQLGEGPNT